MKVQSFQLVTSDCHAKLRVKLHSALVDYIYMPALFHLAHI